MIKVRFNKLCKGLRPVWIFGIQFDRYYTYDAIMITFYRYTMEIVLE